MISSEMILNTSLVTLLGWVSVRFEFLAKKLKVIGERLDVLEKIAMGEAKVMRVSFGNPAAESSTPKTDSPIESSRTDELGL